MARFDEFSSIFGALRRVWSRHPRRLEVINSRTHPTKRGPRGGKMATCDYCNELLPRSAFHVDHIDPVVPVGTERRDMTWDEVVDRMMHCPDDNLQVLCKDCHSIKTKEENAERRRIKRERKGQS